MNDEGKQLKFWMVYGLSRGCPHVKHATKVAAQNEAQRLAQQAPGERFAVLAVVDCFRAEQPIVSAVPIRKMTDAEASAMARDSDIPF